MLFSLEYKRCPVTASAHPSSSFFPSWGVTLCFPCPVAGVELCPGENLRRLHSQFPLEEATCARRASSTEDSDGRADDSSSSRPCLFQAS